MNTLIHTFVTQLYWIDIAIILGGTLAIAFWISFIRSTVLVKKNQDYNASLWKMRKEVYDDCEKNFFL